ncbi:MAG: hypothetical protein ACLQPN_08620 [Bryobacteraceae bacterium]
MAEAVWDTNLTDVSKAGLTSDLDQLAFVWRAGRIFERGLSLGAFLMLRLWVRNRQRSFRRGWGRWGNGRDWSGQFLATYTREVGAEALHGDDDATFLFEPLPDACQALAIVNRGSDLGPKGANLAGFGGRLFPAPLCEAVPGFGNPLLLAFCVFLTLRHSLNSLRRISTYLNSIRQTPGTSTMFDVFQQLTAQIDRTATGSQAENTGSGT